MTYSAQHITVIGGGLAGCEAAWQAARLGCRVTVYEMKPARYSPAHKSQSLAELVCSNSLRSNSLKNAGGVLKQELRELGSLIVRCADQTAVPAGGALAVDRHAFSAAATDAIAAHPLIALERKELGAIPDSGIVIVATGPLTSESLSDDIARRIGSGSLYFHDAISPIVEADSIDTGHTFSASRYNRGTSDYLNCPLSRDQYYAFVSALLEARKVPLKDFETLVPFEGCMPIEVMAERGIETLAHGPMKPVGLVDPRTGAMPYAAVQLRQENREATLFNLVGCQTRLTRPEQKRVFAIIPALRHAAYARFGSLHRNTFINSPSLLLRTLQLQQEPRIFFAGQITGVEGYMESTAAGLVAGLQAARYSTGQLPLTPPPTTVTGALLGCITDKAAADFQPMNANFGILPPLEKKVPKSQRKELLARRALQDIKSWKEKAVGTTGGA